MDRVADEARTGRRWRWWIGGVFGGVLLLVVLAAILVHLAPVRGVVLRRVAATLETQFNLLLNADRLDYNLWRFGATLTNVRLASTATPDDPFLRADRIDVEVPRSILFASFAIDALRMENLRIAITRRADGSTNLPQSNGDGVGPPPAVPIRALSIPSLSVAVRDEPTDLTFDAPALSVEMPPGGGAVRLRRPGTIRRGAIETSLTSFDGGLAFDGRTLRLTRLAVATDEASIVAEGDVSVLVSDPGVDVQFTGQADVERSARWATDAQVPRGRLAFDGAVKGPFARTAVTASVRSDALSYRGLIASGLSSDLAADGEGATVSRFSAGLAGGQIAFTGNTRFDTRDSTVSASWSALDLAVLVRALAPESAVRPAGRATGMLDGKGTGFELARWTADLRNQTGPAVAAPAQLAVPGTTNLRLTGGTWTLNADHAVGGAPVRAALNGRVNPENVTATSLGGALTVADSDLAALLAALQTARVIPGEEALVTGGRVAAETTLSGTLGAPTVATRAAFRDVTSQGIAAIDADVTASGVATQRLAVEVRARQGTANEVTATGTVAVAARTVEARLAGRLADPSTLARGAPVGGAVDLMFDLAGPFDAVSGMGTLTVTDARYDTFQLGRIDSTLALDPMTARIAATIAELNAKISGTMTLAEPRVADAELVLDNADVSRLVRDVETNVPLAGRISLTATAKGPVADWRQGTGSIDVSQLEVQARDLPIRLLGPARAGYSGNAVDVSSFNASAGAVGISVAGRLPLREGGAAVAAADALRLEVFGDVGQVIEAATAAGLVTRPDVTGNGPVVLLATVAGSVERPVLSSDLELHEASVAGGGLPAATDVTLRAHVGEGWLELLTATAEWQKGRFDATGRAPLRLLDAYIPSSVATALASASGRATIEAKATNITPLVLAPFMAADNLAQLEGAIDVTAKLDTASLAVADLEGSVTVDRFDVRVAGLPLEQRMPTQIVLGGGFARIAAWDWTGQGTELGVRGQVGLADRQAAIFTDGRVDLRLATPFVRGAGVTMAGMVEPHIAVTGAITSPVLDGDVSLVGGQIRLAEPQVVATELTARAVLSRSTAQIADLTGTINGGRLSARGELTFGTAGQAESSLTAEIRDMALEFPEGLRSQLDADLTLAVTAEGGDAPLSGRLSGDVTVVEASYREPLAVVAGVLTALRNRGLTAGAASGDSFARRLALDVGVVTENDAIVDNNLARLQLGADLRVIGTAGAPALSGRAELREGGQLYLGRNVYAIESGAIDFANPNVIEPDLDIVAQTRAGGEEIELTMMGTPQELEVDLRSTTSPELGEADVASLLLTGRTLSEVPSREAEIVGEQVLGYLSGDVLGVAGRAVGLDTLRLGGADESLLRRDPTAIATETDPTSRLTVGRRIGERFEVTLSQSLRDGDAQTWILDYLAARRLNLRLVSGDDNLRAYEFRHDISLGGSPTTTGARAERVRERVVAVTFTGNLVFPEARLQDELGIEPGDTFDFTEWQRGRDRLDELYRGEDYREARITERRIEGDGGVTLTFEIDAGPLTAIQVTGYSLRRDTLAAIDNAWAQSFFDDFLLEEAQALVRRELAENWFLQPTVSANFAIAERKVLQISVTPGEPILDRRIEVMADDPALTDEVQDDVENGAFAEDGWRDPGGLRQSVIDFLHARGHLRADARVGSPAVVNREGVLPVTATAGPVFTIGEIRVDGTSPRAPAGLLDGRELTATAPYDAAQVEIERQRLDDAYRDAGFSAARVMVEPAVDDTSHLVTVVFKVEEGPRQILREVVVEGTRSIAAEEVTRALELPVGEPLGADAWLEARTRVFDTGLFQRVDIEIEPSDTVAPTAEEQPVRVVVTVQEWPAARFRYGMRIAEERPIDQVEGRELTPGISADVTRRTLFGRAIATGAAIDYRRRLRLARAFVGSPTLWGLPIESVFTVERSREDQESVTLVTDRIGASWEQRVTVWNSLRLSYSYTFDRDRTFRTRPPLDPLEPTFDITAHVARLTTAAVWDTRDDPADTTLGSLFANNVELAPASLGSDVRFLRYLGQAYHFRPLGSVTLASAARVGLARGLGGQVLISTERFFAGGARSVRGVAEDGLGPVDFLGFPIGGRALVVLNQEVRFPLYRWLRGVGFVDAGNVFNTPADVSLGDLTASVGVGLRLATPFALLRVDYARLWSPRPGDRPGRWTFGIGQAF